MVADESTSPSPSKSSAKAFSVVSAKNAVSRPGGTPPGSAVLSSVTEVGVGEDGTVAPAHFGDRDHPDRFIVISSIGDHDRSGATLGVGGG